MKRSSVSSEAGVALLYSVLSVIFTWPLVLGIGSELLGFVGALLAVPTAAIIQVVFEELYLAEKDPE